MKKALFLLTAFATFSSPMVLAEVTCPDPAMKLPNSPGVNYLRVCHEFSTMAADPTGFVDHIKAANQYTPVAFDSYRDAPAFEWKSPSTFLGKQTISSERQSGFVVTDEGERLEGLLSLELKQGELNEVVLRIGRKNNKFDTDELQSFGLLKSDEYQMQMIEGFSEGNIDLINGVALDGRIRFVGSKRILFRGPGGRIVQLSSDDLDAFTMNGIDANQDFISVKGSLAAVIQPGEYFSLIYNPDPQPIKKSAASAVGGFLKRAAGAAIAQAAFEEVGAALAKSTDSFDPFFWGIDAGQAAADNIMYAPDPTEYRREYRLVNNLGGADIIVYEENVSQELGARLDQCEYFSSKGEAEKVTALNIDNMETLSLWVNDCSEDYEPVDLQQLFSQ